jgi:hypothetical protein
MQNFVAASPEEPRQTMLGNGALAQKDATGLYFSDEHPTA